MRVEFESVKRLGFPGLLANAAIVFDEAGPFSGLCLKGFAVWKSKKIEGTLTVTFPARPYKGKQYWLLRAVGSDESPVWALRQLIVKEYQEWSARNVASTL